MPVRHSAGPTLYLQLPLSLPHFDKLMIGIKTWENKPRSLHLLLSVCQQRISIQFFSCQAESIQFNLVYLHERTTLRGYYDTRSTLLHAVPLVILFSWSLYHSVLHLSTSCSRPVPVALPLTPLGPPAVAEPAADPAGTVWAVHRHSNARSDSLGSDARSSQGKEAPAQKKGRVEEKS